MPVIHVEEQSQTPTLYTPQLALVLYSAGSETLTCKHPVHTNARGQAVLGAARVITDEDRQELLSALGRTHLLPTRANTLAASSTACAWWTPATVRSMLFSPKYDDTRSVARFSGVALPHPPLVFIATGRSLTVFALEENERPAMDTPLCHAPYWNTFPGNGVCQGSTRYPAKASPAEQEAWEDAFFLSEFTGPSRGDVYMQWGASYEELLAHLQQLGHFPVEVLKRSGKTLGQALAP